MPLFQPVVPDSCLWWGGKKCVRKVKNARGPSHWRVCCSPWEEFSCFTHRPGMLEVQAHEFNDCLMIYKNVGLCMRGVCTPWHCTPWHNLEIF